MTLILGMVRPEGLYLSVDYRVTDSRTGCVVDDAVTKHLRLQYPPVEGGPQALMAFTGLAVLPDREATRMGDWIRETLRGESDVFDLSMKHLLDRLNRDIAKYRQPLIINIIVIDGSRQLYGGFSNMFSAPKATVRIARTFHYALHEVAETLVFGNGASILSKASMRRLQRLTDLSDAVPRRPQDYMKLMALTNRAIAAKEPTVSPYCHVAYINAPGFKFGPAMQVFAEKGEPVDFDFSMILGGVDLTPFVKAFVNQSIPFLQGRSDSFEFDMPDDFRRRP